MRKRGLRGCVLLALFATLAGCAGGTAPSGSGQAPAPGSGEKPAAGTPVRGGTLKFGLQRDPIAFDPHISYGISNDSLQGSVYDTLIEYDEQGGFRGALAEKWETPDPTTYIFHLRKGVKFQSGKEFTADDVIATLKRVGDPNTKAARKATVDSLASYEATDPATVKLVLKKPDATFLHALASPVMYIVSSDDINSGFDFKAKMNGTGAFSLESYEPQARYVLARHAGYWKQGMPYLDQIIQIPIQDDKARINALRSGEVDMIEYVPWQEMDGLTRDFNVYRHQSVFNTVRLNNGQPPLDKKEVRQALNFVVDRQEVMNLAFGGQGRIIDGPLQPAGSPYYFKELEGYYKKDHEKAMALLKQAGYNSPADLPTLELTVATLSVHSETAQVVQQQLQKFGLKVQWKTVEVATMTANRTAGTYMMQQDGLSMAWPDPDYLRTYYHSQGTNHALGVKFANARLDELLEDGAANLDQAKRKSDYLEAEKIILDEAPWIFLLWRPQAEALTKKVQGYVVIPSGLGSFNVNRFESLWIDESAK